MWPAAPPPDPRLGVRVAGLELASPLGLSAGFDKDATAWAGMLRLGFGFVEVGTLTPRPQPGNPRPRLFRLAEDEAVINRLGFNNGGLEAALARLPSPPVATVGVNVGANKDSADRVRDYANGVRRAAPHARFITVNISSPNTPGLRALQSGAALAELLSAVREARGGGGPPLFLKLAPDLDPGDPERIVGAALAHGVDALVLTNTTVSRPQLRSAHARETGGLSGRPLAAPSLATLRTFAAVAGGRLPLVSVGGIATAADVLERLRAGASAVQLYTALVYEGLGLPARLNRELAALMARDGLNAAEIVGTAVRS